MDVEVLTRLPRHRVVPRALGCEEVTYRLTRQRSVLAYVGGEAFKVQGPTQLKVRRSLRIWPRGAQQSLFHWPHRVPVRLVEAPPADKIGGPEAKDCGNQVLLVVFRSATSKLPLRH
jgi:hypothetical protein